MEAHNHAGVVLLRVHNFLVVCFNQQSQGHAVGTQGGLNHVRNVVLARFGIEVGQILTGVLLMLGQIVVGTVGHAPELAPTEREQILKVGGCLGVEGQFFRLVVTQTEVLLAYVQTLQPVVAIGSPVLEPLQIRVGLAEEFQLHLLELADTEDEVTGGDLVTEGLTYLANAEGQLAAGGALDVVEVYEDTLGGLGTEVHLVGGVLGNALVGLVHQIELTDIGEIGLAAAGAGHVVFTDEVHQSLAVHSLHVYVHIVFVYEIFHQLVCAVTHLAGLAVDQRIVEGGHVAGGNPHLGIHQDGGVQAYVVGVLLNEFLPPGTLDVVLQFNAEGAVVPGVGKTAVNFGACINKTSVFAERNDLLHSFFAVGHTSTHNGYPFGLKYRGLVVCILRRIGTGQTAVIFEEGYGTVRVGGEVAGGRIGGGDILAGIVQRRLFEGGVVPRVDQADLGDEIRYGQRSVCHSVGTDAVIERGEVRFRHGGQRIHNRGEEVYEQGVPGSHVCLGFDLVMYHKSGGAGAVDLVVADLIEQGDQILLLGQGLLCGADLTVVVQIACQIHMDAAHIGDDLGKLGYVDYHIVVNI